MAKGLFFRVIDSKAQDDANISHAQCYLDVPEYHFEVFLSH